MAISNPQASKDRRRAIPRGEQPARNRQRAPRRRVSHHARSAATRRSSAAPAVVVPKGFRKHRLSKNTTLPPEHQASNLSRSRRRRLASPRAGC